MTLSEIFDRVLVLSGQYQLTSSQIDLDYTSFSKLVQHALAMYSRWRPGIINYNKNIPTTFYTFLVSEGQPDWISECNPIQVLGMPWQLFDWRKQKLQEKSSFVWRYDKTTYTLYVQAGGLFEIVGVFKHKITIPEGETESPENWEILTVDPDIDDQFLELVTGHFMYAVGLARGSFGGLELGFTIDAATMKTDGKVRIKETTDWLQNNGKWYLAWG